MAGETSSTYMNMPVPAVGVTAGPTYATDIDSCLSIIDSHDHSPGSGVPIGSSGINISSDLTFNNYNITNPRSVRLYQQSAVLVLGTDLRCIYCVSDDLYYNDGSGNQVRITQGGGVAGSPGSIGSLTSPASCTYVLASTKFVFQSAANTSALLDCGSILMRNSTASSNALTLAPPNAMGSNYTVTLPALPAASSALIISNSGVITAAASNITSAMLASNLNLPGKAVQENGNNVVVSNTNATNSLAVIRFISDAGGTVTSGEGASIVAGTPGSYAITFTTPFDDIPSVQVTIVNTQSRTCTIDAVSTSGFTLYIWTLSSALSAQSFHVVAIGQRA